MNGHDTPAKWFLVGTFYSAALGRVNAYSDTPGTQATWKPAWKGCIVYNVLAHTRHDAQARGKELRWDHERKARRKRA